MFSTNSLIQYVCMLLIVPCITSTVKHHYESDSLFHDMNGSSEYTTVTSKDAGNFVGVRATHFTTKASAADATGRNYSNNEQEKDEADRKTCIGDSFDVEKCVIFLKRKLVKGTPIETKISEVLKKLALCLHTDGSIVHIDPQVQMCCNGVMNKTAYEECCEGKVFDNRKHICCNNTLYEKTNRSGCCSSYLYDTKKSLCCNGSLPVVSRLQNMECCGNQTFNNSIHLCCNDNIQPIHGLRNKKGDCCNDTSYHVGCHTCGNGTTLYAHFDDSSEICCQGKIMHRIYGNSSECCHRRIMNNDTDTCVENKVVPKPKYDTSPESFSTAPQPSVTSGNKDKSIDVIENEDISKTVEVSIYTAVGTSIGFLPIVALILFGVCWRKRCNKYQNDPFIEEKEVVKLKEINESKQARNCDISESLLEGNEDEQDNIEKICYTNEIVNSENENVYSERFYITSGHMTLPDVLNNIEKNYISDKTNLISTHFKEIHTQTVHENVVKRTIFGHSFEHIILLNESTTTLEIPGSDVTLCLPKHVMDTSMVEVNCSSFSSLPDLRKKLGLSDDEVLASPVVEFSVTGYSVLQEHARVVVPFVGNASDLIVRKFQSDEGLNTVAISVEIAEKYKQNEDLDIFYITKGSTVIIYTKSFSGYFCTRYRHKIRNDLSLKTFIFGSYKRINRRYEVGISTYIADEIFKFKDYQKRMVENETRQGRGQLKECFLSMPKHNLNDDDYIEAIIKPGNGEDVWIHRLHPRTKKPLQEVRKEIRLNCVAQKCKNCPSFHSHEPEIPYCTEWYLTTAKIDTIPSEIFQCIIDLSICKRETEFKMETSIFIEELMLRSKDRLPVKEDFMTAMTIPVPDENCSDDPAQIRVRPG